MQNPRLIGDTPQQHMGDEADEVARSSAQMPGNPLHTGDEKWPVAIRHIKSYLDGRGVARFISARRWENRDRIFLAGGENVIPSEWVSVRRYSCAEKHAGLCFTKDAAVYNSSLLMAGHLEKYLTASRSKSYVQLAGYKALGARIRLR